MLGISWSLPNAFGLLPSNQLPVQKMDKIATVIAKFTGRSEMMFTKCAIQLQYAYHHKIYNTSSPTLYSFPCTESVAKTFPNYLSIPTQVWKPVLMIKIAVGHSQAIRLLVKIWSAFTQRIQRWHYIHVTGWMGDKKACTDSSPSSADHGHEPSYMLQG